MQFGFKVEVSGDYALFSRPELKVERVSYDVITPSAARGILEAVFWKPAIRYVIDGITVCNKIHFENIRRNEVSSKASAGKSYIFAAEDRAQRASLVLKDVKYIIAFHFEATDKLGERDLAEGVFNHGKFADELRRRLLKGQCFHQPYLGCREFPAKLRLLMEDESPPPPITETRNLGLMLYDIDYIKDDCVNMTEWNPTYFMAQMKNGIIDLQHVEVLR